MKFVLAIFMFLTGTVVDAQEMRDPSLSSPPSLQAKPLAKWIVNKVPWDEWFKKNCQVTDKAEYVHFFWDAQDFKLNFEVKDKKSRLADAALQLVSRLYPQDATADRVKVDIVYVLERDSYGLPKWDSLQQVAHFEFLKSKASKLIKHKVPLTEIQMKKIFDKFEIF